eukprot:PLAT11403.1.p1 GENE.PLAT11403.1~~PLAT11403.1.p1  ORF type:complete len:1762 (+),score=844.46 PLAT11403.1:770-5287(+)
MLHNALLLPLSYRLLMADPDSREGDMIAVEGGDVDVGGFVSLVAFQRDRQYFVSFRVRGFQWSVVLPLRPTKLPSVGKPTVAELRIEDGAGLLQSLRLEYAAEAAACVQLTLYASFWLVNLSGRPLTYSHVTSSKAEALLIGGQMGPVVEDTWEGQRFYPLFGWKSKLLPTDPKPWTNRARNSKTLRSKESIQLPDPFLWSWEGDWTVDINHHTDDEGWEYALDWPHAFSPSKRITDHVRRRRWVRRRVCNADAVAALSRPASRRGSASEEMEEAKREAGLPGVVADAITSDLEDAAEGSWVLQHAGSQLTMYGPLSEARDRLRVRIDDSEWSKPIPLSTAGLSGVVQVQERHGAVADAMAELTVAVQTKVRLAGGLFFRTRMILFSPRFVVVNMMPLPLALRQVKTAGEVIVRSHQTLPFNWVDGSAPPFVMAHVEGTLWSGPFEIDRVGTFDIKLLLAGSGSSEREEDMVLVRVDVRQTDSGAVFVRFSEENAAFPLYRVENRSLDVVYYRQAGTNPKRWPEEVLQPQCSRWFSWSDLSLAERRVHLRIGEAVMKLDIDSASTLEIANLAAVEATEPVGDDAELLRYGQPLVIKCINDGFMWTVRSSATAWRAERSAMQCAPVFFAGAGGGSRAGLRLCYGQTVSLRCNMPYGEARFLSVSSTGALLWWHTEASLASAVMDECTFVLGGGVEGDELRHGLPFYLRACRYPDCIVAGSGRFGLSASTGLSEWSFLSARSVQYDALPERTVVAHVDFDGPTRVLRISGYDNLGVGSASASGEGESEGAIHMQLQLMLASASLSLVDHTPEELLCVHAEQLTFSYIHAERVTAIDVAVSQLQVDNQLTNASLQLVLAATPQDGSSADSADGGGGGGDAGSGSRNMFELHVVRKHSKALRLAHIAYAGVLLQEFELGVDEELVRRLYALLSAVRQTKDVRPGPASSLAQGGAAADVVGRYVRRLAAEASRAGTQESAKQQRLYLEHVELGAVACNFSLQRQSSGAAKVRSHVTAWLQAIGFVLSNMHRASLLLNGMEVDHVFASRGDLVRALTAHYRQQLLRQVHKLLGAVDVLGNPVRLVSGLGRGMSDFFIHPARGALKSPVAFSRGLATGTSSLVKHTLGSVGVAASSVAGSVGKGVAFLSFDDKYVAARKARMRDRKPTGVLEGLAEGGRDLGRGIAAGITGLVSAPVEGARRGGAAGLLRGVAKGVLGLAVKPASGVLDLAQRAGQGLAGAVGSGGAAFELPGRRRAPRLLQGRERRLLAYDVLEERVYAVMQLLAMLAMDDGDVKRRAGSSGSRRSSRSGSSSSDDALVGRMRDTYLYHFRLPGTPFFLLITAHRAVLLPLAGEVKAGMSLWQIPFRYEEGSSRLATRLSAALADWAADSDVFAAFNMRWARLETAVVADPYFELAGQREGVSEACRMLHGLSLQQEPAHAMSQLQRLVATLEADGVRAPYKWFAFAVTHCELRHALQLFIVLRAVFATATDRHRQMVLRFISTLVAELTE